MMDAIKFWWNPKKHYKENTALLKNWAKKVYKKDNYTCTRCKYKAGGDLRIEAHHIYPKSKYPRMAYRVSNGVVLCERCHRTDRDSYHALNGSKGDRRMFKKWLRGTSKTKKNNDSLLLSISGVVIIITFATAILSGVIN